MKNLILIGVCVFLTLSLKSQIISYNCNEYEKSVVLIEDGKCNTNPFILVFEDNFDGTKLDSTKWNSIIGVVRDQNHEKEKQWYTSGNIEVNNGILKLISKKEALYGKCFDIWENNELKTYCQNFNYTSAEIDSKYKFGYGKFEIRCKIPKGKGFFPAFWMYGGPIWNEIDVFEFWNKYDATHNLDLNRSTKVHNMNLYYDYNSDGSGENCPKSYKGVDFSREFHVFSVVWTPYKVEWYVDDDLKRVSTLFHSITGQIVDCNSILANEQYILYQAFPKNPMNIIANLAIQSGIESPDETTAFPSSIEIDYIKYYKQIACNQTINILDVSDLNLSSEVYNVIVGTTIHISGDVSLQSGQQLEVIASDQIEIESGFTSEAGSVFVARIDNNICSDVSGINIHPSPAYNKENNILSTEEFSDQAFFFDDYSNQIKPSIKPNPCKDKFFVESFSLNQTYTFQCTNIEGRHIDIHPIVMGDKIEIDLSNYSSGMYFLKMIGDDNLDVILFKINKE